VSDLLAEDERLGVALETAGDDARHGAGVGDLCGVGCGVWIEPCCRDRGQPRAQDATLDRVRGREAVIRDTDSVGGLLDQRLHGPGDHGGRGGLDLLHLGRRERTHLDEAPGEHHRRIECRPRRLLLARAVLERAARERSVLVEEAVRQRLHEHRPRRGGMHPGRLHRGQDGQRVHPVDDEGRHVVARRADRELLEARRLDQRRGDRVPVVLHQGDEREAPGAGERERLMEGPDRQPAVAHHRHGDTAVPAQLGRQRSARSSRNASANNRARRDAGRGVRQVHRATPAAAKALRETQDLRHRAPDRSDDLRRCVARG
jgi:hypothetical protein